MAYGLYIAAEGAQVQSTRLEMLSNNIANAATPGFKRELAVFQARYAEATQRGQDYPGSRSINDLGGGIELLGSRTDFSQGSMSKTGSETDMAIGGDGFFVVKRGNQNMLTRAGNFEFSADGTLQNPDGYPVMSEDGQPIVVDPAAGPITVTSSGAVQQAGATIASVAIVQPQSLGDLAKAAGNLFTPLGPTTPLAPEQRQVLPGHLEQSGVKPAQEMIEMIETSRVFEANSNMIHYQDQMLETLISRLLKGTT
jgi:flagellar basal-body rod protein FlgF